jgi:SAM-dependent methyltransferase
MNDRHVPREQRTVFGEVAELYDRVRPGYPEALVDDVLALADPPVSRFLEVGPGTGKATVLFARRGLEAVVLEPSPEMAAVAVRNLLPFPRVSIELSTLEDWPLRPGAFDLVVSAQAWHWVTPEVGYAKVHQALRPSGGLAFFWNRPRWEDEALRGEFEAVYRAQTPGLLAKAPGFPGLTQSPEEDFGNDMAATGLFAPVVERTYHSRREYTTEEYLELLQTQSDHRMLPEDQLDQLLHGVAGILEAAGGGLRIDYDTRLYFTKRLP